MPENEKTLYDVLGVGRDAKLTDIGRAYNRIKADQQKETSAPNPRLVAQAKVAYETLSDPDKREEYDAVLRRRLLTGQGQKHRGARIAAACVAVVAAIGTGYYGWQSSRVVVPPEARPLAPDQLLAAVTPQLGLVQAALISGEVRDLGTAITIREGRMVTTCRGFAAGMILTVKFPEGPSKAELTNLNEDLDVCVLAVKDARAAVKFTGVVPGAQDILQAVFVGADGRAQARQVSGARAITEAVGPAFEVKAAPLPNGAALFDNRARLVGIAVTPHAATDGMAFALGAGRIVQAKGTAMERQVEDTPAPARPAPQPTPAEDPKQKAMSASEKAAHERAEALRKAEENMK